MIPSVEQCLRLMDDYRMPEHIRAHSIMVTKVARVISHSLNARGARLSLDKITAGALLHDIGKHQALEYGGDHVKIGQRICLERGMPEIAEIVEQHVILKPETFDAPFSEIQVIYYSDKRVNHHRVVSLEERLEYILDRYGTKGPDISEAIKKNFEVCKELEQRIFEVLEFEPSELAVLAGRERIGGGS